MILISNREMHGEVIIDDIAHPIAQMSPLTHPLPLESTNAVLVPFQHHNRVLEKRSMEIHLDITSLNHPVTDMNKFVSFLKNHQILSALRVLELVEVRSDNTHVFKTRT